MLMSTQEPVNASFLYSGSVLHPGAKMHQRADNLKQAAESCEQLDVIERNVDLWKNSVLNSLKRSESTAGDITEHQGHSYSTPLILILLHFDEHPFYRSKLVFVVLRFGVLRPLIL